MTKRLVYNKSTRTFSDDDKRFPKLNSALQAIINRLHGTNHQNGTRIAESSLKIHADLYCEGEVVATDIFKDHSPEGDANISINENSLFPMDQSNIDESRFKVRFDLTKSHPGLKSALNDYLKDLSPRRTCTGNKYCFIKLSELKR